MPDVDLPTHCCGKLKMKILWEIKNENFVGN